MARYLLDSNILIGILRNYQTTLDLVDRLSEESVPICSALSVYEIEVGARPHEMEKTRAFLYSLEIASIDRDIATRAASLARFNRSRGRAIDPVDLHIAATGLVWGLTLVTFNVKDFHFPGLSVYQEMPD